MPSPLLSNEIAIAMKLELQSASNFLVHLVRLGRANLSETQLERFQNAVIEVLQRRYRDHWFPEKPYKGSGYRCIRINGKLDPVIVQAGETCGLSPTIIRSTFPSELTMWIDPLEVSYRIGENGSICVLYEFKEGPSNEPWKPKYYNTNSSKAPLDNKNKSTTHNNQKNLQQSSDDNATTSVVAACKDSIRKMDFLLDPRKSVSIEQLAAYVSS
jgi:protein Tob/BTG